MRRTAFNAGFSASFMLITVTVLVCTHGHIAPKPVSWSDIFWDLLFLVVWSGATMDLYKFFKGEN